MVSAFFFFFFNPWRRSDILAEIILFCVNLSPFSPRNKEFGYLEKSHFLWEGEFPEFPERNVLNSRIPKDIYSIPGKFPSIIRWLIRGTIGESDDISYPWSPRGIFETSCETLRFIFLYFRKMREKCPCGDCMRYDFSVSKLIVCVFIFLPTLCQPFLPPGKKK